MHEPLETLLDSYEAGHLDRRQLIGALVAMTLGLPSSRTAPGSIAPLRARTINHVTLSVGDLGRSKAFYRQLLGIEARNENARSCQFPLENGFVVLDTYPGEDGHPRGLDHVCFGIDNFGATEVFERLRRDQPGLRPTLEYGTQVYVRDPDGARVQLSAADYKT
jgi:catechol 2,3-dioxygenase-like lactoylglutathione lyase family enzyme